MDVNGFQSYARIFVASYSLTKICKSAKRPLAWWGRPFAPNSQKSCKLRGISRAWHSTGWPATVSAQMHMHTFYQSTSESDSICQLTKNSGKKNLDTPSAMNGRFLNSNWLHVSPGWTRSVHVTWLVATTSLKYLLKLVIAHHTTENDWMRSGQTCTRYWNL